MSGRCVELMLSLRESSVGLEGHKAVGLADEITVLEPFKFIHLIANSSSNTG